MNFTLNMYVKTVRIEDTYISFGVRLNDEEKQHTVWFNFICIGVALGKLKERGLTSGQRVNILRSFSKVGHDGRLVWIVTDVE